MTTRDLWLVVDVDDTGHPRGRLWVGFHDSPEAAWDAVDAHSAASPGADPWRAFRLVPVDRSGDPDAVDVFRDVHEILHTHQPHPDAAGACVCGWGSKRFSGLRHRWHVAEEIARLFTAALPRDVPAVPLDQVRRLRDAWARRQELAFAADLLDTFITEASQPRLTGERVAP